jgi:hypothetical protein
LRRGKILWLPSTSAAPAQKGSQFQQAINQQAKPKINQSPKIQLERVMLGGGWQIGIQGKVQAIAQQNGNQAFQPLLS